MDLSNCDLEPIYIPSLIQPHGMLIAAQSADLRIAYVSENASSFLGLAASSILERTLPEVFGIDQVAAIEEAPGAGTLCSQRHPHVSFSTLREQEV